MISDWPITIKINRIRSENKKLREDLKDLKEAFNDVLTHSRKLCEAAGVQVVALELRVAGTMKRRTNYQSASLRAR